MTVFFFKVFGILNTSAVLKQEKLEKFRINEEINSFIKFPRKKYMGFR